MKISRLVVEKKMLLFLVVLGCSTVIHFVYNRAWKWTNLKVVMGVGADPRAGNYSSKSTTVDLLQVTATSLLNASNVRGVGVSGTPIQNRVDLHDVHVEDQVFVSGSPTRNPVDLHKEDPFLGHTGEVTTDHDSGVTTSHPSSSDTGRRQPRATIAVGGGITSKGLSDVHESNVASKMLLFSVFLPTFCRTASPQFAYSIYLAYDHTDRVFRDGRLQTAFRRTFDAETRRFCTANGGSGSDVDISLHLIECSHAGKPTWAQNDAMMEAYLDHVDYFYRINDDTKMLTAGWTEKFISTLEGYHPPRVGVVGPKHFGGNIGILTYDFVHRTHVEIFGFYYPRIFTGWWADDWITKVYAPNRSTKLSEVELSHTMSLGQRYGLEWSAYPRLLAQIDIGKQTISRYAVANNYYVYSVS